MTGKSEGSNKCVCVVCMFIITGVNFLLLFLRISLNACFPTFVYVNKKSSHANCVRIIVLKFVTSF